MRGPAFADRAGGGCRLSAIRTREKSRRLCGDAGLTTISAVLKREAAFPARAGLRRTRALEHLAYEFGWAPVFRPGAM